MKLLLLFFLLEYSDFAPLPAADANAKFSENDLYALREASIIRGNYKDVASQFNGALISSARINTFWTPGIENSPLRNLLYYYPTGPNLHQGHVVAWLGQSIIVQFLQAYQINTVRFWMWDIDNRETDMQVFAIAADRKTEKVIFDDIRTKPNVLSFKNLSNINYNKQMLQRFRINWYQAQDFTVEEGIIQTIQVLRQSKYKPSMPFDYQQTYKLNNNNLLHIIKYYRTEI
ncbi:unnamed protein product [Paramecium octaurelia]|uniref:Uncharacterized protein n=1 Tax=Paramecium octaurelia TaxID=43137 RepID=A0A8S1T6H1_PAROT|nr:unnamed protein product [Paramecium octaurelia]CAD8146596.1 unnamed protein product [Paramecium octaurelia]